MATDLWQMQREFSFVVPHDPNRPTMSNVSLLYRYNTAPPNYEEAVAESIVEGSHGDPSPVMVDDITFAADADIANSRGHWTNSRPIGQHYIEVGDAAADHVVTSHYEYPDAGRYPDAGSYPHGDPPPYGLPFEDSMPC
jgi:hypothetical protein